MTWKPEIQTWLITRPIPYERNTKAHPPDQVNRLAGSIAKNGFVQPILVDKDGVVIAGHGRLLAAQALGMQEVPVIVADHLAEGEVRALRIADNRLNESPWDTDMLRFELKGLEDLGIEINVSAFDVPDISKFIEDGKIVEGLFDSPRHTGEIGEKSNAVPGEDDVPPVPEKLSWVKPGDLWSLGRHRLLCADSSVRSNVDRLLSGAYVDFLFTDPPYGMRLDTEFHQGEKVSGNSYAPVIGDDQDYDPSFLIDTFQKAREVFIWGADYFHRKLPDGGSFMVWDKRNDQLEKAVGNDFELCWSREHHKRLVYRKLWSGVTARERDSKRCHPTQKPVNLAEWFFERWGKLKDVVADLYLGSGSTLIACEKMDRTCLGMELDLHYCSVILRRWAEFAGEDPVREDGMPLSELMGAGLEPAPTET